MKNYLSRTLSLCLLCTASLSLAQTQSIEYYMAGLHNQQNTHNNDPLASTTVPDFGIQAIGPELDETDVRYGYAVGLTFKVGTRFLSRCSGTLLTQDWVLTAGHCVDQHTLHTLFKLKDDDVLTHKIMLIGNTDIRDDEGNQTHFIDIKGQADAQPQLHVHAEYAFPSLQNAEKRIAFAQDDFAVFQLNSAAPADYIPAFLPSRYSFTRHQVEGKKLTVVGASPVYGDSDQTDGTLDITFRKARPTVGAGDGAERDAFREDEYRHNILYTNRLLCGGDSGSSITTRQRPATVLGVTSQGSNAQKGQCGGGDNSQENFNLFGAVNLENNPALVDILAHAGIDYLQNTVYISDTHYTGVFIDNPIEAQGRDARAVIDLKAISALSRSVKATVIGIRADGSFTKLGNRRLKSHRYQGTAELRLNQLDQYASLLVAFKPSRVDHGAEVSVNVIRQP
ncbi:trypsin-like serine protease [Pseudoalteromonas rubra]|uniref:Trypsin-like serine protease n=1 Tax=Pseudoalteromonas rubra TaxID=43658 RepID=A0A5S3UXH6_9GAMM|nr:trypsin-like serine protease [Pseudoalteromonas rubra]QPB84986.1 trypsin-like serine protease [Pseudoalteromonas rubra]